MEKVIKNMKNYLVILSKSYIVEMKAKSELEAQRLAEVYTSNITDISTHQDKEEYGFEITQITCGLNEVFEASEISRK